MAARGCLLALACILLVTYGAADQAVENSGLPPPAEVSSVHTFPDHPSKHFPVGTVITTVFGIRNDGTEVYNISGVAGSLSAPAANNMQVQNLTQQRYFQALEPGEELSLEYKFMVDPRLPAAEYDMQLILISHDNKGGFFSNTLFNQTVNFVEVKKLIDTELVFMYLILASLVGLAGWFAYSKMLDMGVIKKSRKTKKVETTKGADDHDEWVKGTPYDSFRKRKASLTERRTSASEKKAATDAAVRK